MATKRGMGRGLGAILPAAGEAPEGALREVPVVSIIPNPSQPRRRFDPESISALAESLRSAGVIQPLIARALGDGRYELIAGERRWRAAREAGLETVPVVLRDDDEARRMQIALIENVAREQLNPVDEARACAALVEDLGLTKEELGRRIGRSRAAVSNLVRLLDLPDDVLALLADGSLSEGHGRALLIAKSADDRSRLAKTAAAQGWSVRETERRAGEPAKSPKAPERRDPDREAMIEEAEDALERALGTGVRVRSTAKGLRAEIAFEDLGELLEFARRRG